MISSEIILSPTKTPLKRLLWGSFLDWLFWGCKRNTIFRAYLRWILRVKWNSGVALMTKYFLWVLTNTLGLMANLWMLATLASQIPILAPALPPLGLGFFDLTPFDQKTGHSSLRVYQDPRRLIFWVGCFNSIGYHVWIKS